MASPATKTKYEDVVMFEHQHIRQGSRGDVGAADKSRPTPQEIANHMQMMERLESEGVCS
jgi:hypothetical protein